MKVGIVGCSNAQPTEWSSRLEQLKATLKELGMEAVCSPYLFSSDSAFSGSPKQRAEALNEFYRDDSIQEIFDISGGDVANQVIGYLDYDAITRRPKRLWGYSDLTCVLNAIYARTGQACMLYQVRNLIGDDGDEQKKWWRQGTLSDFECEWYRGSAMEGVVVGGNIRCMLKLAGTPYWPDVRGKILLMEGLGTTSANAAAYIAQLSQMGALDVAAGVLLGTFTHMDAVKARPSFDELLLQSLPKDTPVAHTRQIGHGSDSRAICIGRRLRLSSED